MISLIIVGEPNHCSHYRRVTLWDIDSRALYMQLLIFPSFCFLTCVYGGENRHGGRRCKFIILQYLRSFIGIHWQHRVSCWYDKQYSTTVYTVYYERKHF